MAVTYTIATVNGKIGSIVVTPSDVKIMPDYYLNIKSVKLVGDNPFLSDGTTLNPQATFSLFCQERNTWLIKDMPMSRVTSIGGSATPATLALTLAAIAALLAE
jgi:hypothetical protein